MGLAGVELSLAELSAIGVRRVSVDSALYRTALGAAPRAAREMRGQGSFAFAKEASPAGAQPDFRGHTLGNLLYPDAAGGGFAEMHGLSVHAQRHGLVVLAL